MPTLICTHALMQRSKLPKFERYTYMFKCVLMDNEYIANVNLNSLFPFCSLFFVFFFIFLNEQPRARRCPPRELNRKAETLTTLTDYQCDVEGT